MTMWIASKIRRRAVLALFAATSLLALERAAHAEEPGVSPQALKIGILGSLTGPAAIFGTGNLAGATLAFEEVNAAGGINGRQLEWVSLDDESSPPKGIVAYKRLVDQEEVFAVFGPASSAVGQALVPTMKQSGTPTFITIFSTPAVTEPPIDNVFRSGTMSDSQAGAAIADYVVDHLSAKSVALIRQSDEYGKHGGDSVIERLAERNVGLASDEQFNVTDTDFTSQLARIVQTGPDVLVIYGFPNPTAIITRQAKQLGLTATIMGSNAAGSRKYPEIVGDAAAGTHNVVTLTVLPEGSDPLALEFGAKFVARFPDLARQGRPDLADVLAYGGAQVFLEGLKRAGTEPTQQGLIDALETIKAFKAPFILPTTYGEAIREGNQAAGVVEIQPDLSRKLMPFVLSASNGSSQ